MTERNPGQPEDVRSAASIQVTIGTTVMTAALAIIAAEAGVTTFYLEHRSLQIWALAALVVAALIVIAGVIVGGRALNDLSVSGYYGDWDIFSVSGAFNLQALLSLVAAVLVVVAVAAGSSPVKSEADALQALQKRLVRDEAQLVHLQREIDAAKRSAAKTQPHKGGGGR